MPVPIAPIAVTAAKYGSVALAAYVLARQTEHGRTDQRAEDAMDALSDGVALHTPRDRDQWNLSARMRRVVRLGQTGPGVEVDASLLGRLRFRRV